MRPIKSADKSAGALDSNARIRISVACCAIAECKAGKHRCFAPASRLFRRGNIADAQSGITQHCIQYRRSKCRLRPALDGVISSLSFPASRVLFARWDLHARRDRRLLRIGWRTCGGCRRSCAVHGSREDIHAATSQRIERRNRPPDLLFGANTAAFVILLPRHFINNFQKSDTMFIICAWRCRIGQSLYLRVLVIRQPQDAAIAA